MPAIFHAYEAGLNLALGQVVSSVEGRVPANAPSRRDTIEKQILCEDTSYRSYWSERCDRVRLEGQTPPPPPLHYPTGPRALRWIVGPQ